MMERMDYGSSFWQPMRPPRPPPSPHPGLPCVLSLSLSLSLSRAYKEESLRRRERAMPARESELHSALDRSLGISRSGFNFKLAVSFICAPRFCCFQVPTFT